MRKLVVKNFSCIQAATLELSKLTIIIGPQASGKSVLSKLAYFFTSIVTANATKVAETEPPFPEFRASIATDFSEWFPPSAWGSKRFTIDFSYGPFKTRIIRKTRSGKVLNQVSVTLSKDFRDFYENLLADIKKYLGKARINESVAPYELQWGVRELARRATRSWFDTGLYTSQAFVPAGRSFFTSVGRTLMAFEHTRILDPVTLSFGRRYSALRESGFRREVVHGPSSFGPLGRVLFDEILGGKLMKAGEKEFIRTNDGRQIPLSALSSGQQELLPLAILLTSFVPSEADVPARYRREIHSWICIEEPEAHLFPRAQCRLVEVLAAIVSPRHSNTELLITTHSPYVLSKFNNLIKAGSLSSKRGLMKLIQAKYPLHSWLPRGVVQAYALIDGQLMPILDEDGLIAADYLDDVSGDIAREFSQLLEIELTKNEKK